MQSEKNEVKCQFINFQIFGFIVLMGLFLTINVDKQPMLPKIVEAVNNLWHNPTDAFYT